MNRNDENPRTDKKSGCIVDDPSSSTAKTATNNDANTEANTKANTESNTEDNTAVNMSANI